MNRDNNEQWQSVFHPWVFKTQVLQTLITWVSVSPGPPGTLCSLDCVIALTTSEDIDCVIALTTQEIHEDKAIYCVIALTAPWWQYRMLHNHVTRGIEEIEEIKGRKLWLKNGTFEVNKLNTHQFSPKYEGSVFIYLSWVFLLALYNM